ncbi:hypothetical protein [Dermacoccus abyssi]|uniref:hypothetical protein n=1 Tax=Dermacoccus abyssi TaxID=322596 RepID=UPI0030B82823
MPNHPHDRLASPAPLVLRGRRFDARHPAVMAIVNRTPDSFYAGNRHSDLDDALTALETASPRARTSSTSVEYGQAARVRG